MSRGAARGVFAGFLGLIALHAVGTQGGSGRVSEFFGDLAGAVERVLDPDVPAIPDRRAGAAPSPERIADAKAAGGAQGTTSGRAFGRLPIPEAPKPPNQKD